MTNLDSLYPLPKGQKLDPVTRSNLAKRVRAGLKLAAITLGMFVFMAVVIAGFAWTMATLARALPLPVFASFFLVAFFLIVFLVGFLQKPT